MGVEGSLALSLPKMCEFRRDRLVMIVCIFMTQPLPFLVLNRVGPYEMKTIRSNIRAA